MRGAMQPRTWLALIALAFACPLRAAPAASAEMLAAECDGLLRLAVRKPYGWAFEAADPRPHLRPGEKLARDASVVDLDPSATPAGGLLLLYAGRELGNETYIDAGRRIARGLMASQQSNGRVPARAVFSSSAGGRDVASPLQDPAPTRAALALLLAVHEHDPSDEQVKRGASRCALWLAREQSPAGTWQTLVTLEGHASPMRLVCLHTRDYRDSTLALLYASDVLNETFLKKSAQRPVDQLLKMTIDPSVTAKGLWRGFYELDGTTTAKVADYDRAVDTLATRFALQAVLGEHLFNGSPVSLEALKAAAKSLRGLRYEDGLWQRMYVMRHNEVPARQKGPAPRPDRNPFADAPPVEGDLSAVADFGLPPVLDAIERLMASGREEYRKGLARRLTDRQHVALMLAGMSDQPFIAEPAGDRSVAEGASGADTLARRLRRAHGLLLAIKAEKAGKL